MTNAHKKCAEAATTLRELLLTASRRGISIEDSFSHFDHGKDGVIDLSQFILGLRSLGIPLSVEAASLLLRHLSRDSATHLTSDDFARLARDNTVTKKTSKKNIQKQVVATDECQ